MRVSDEQIRSLIILDAKGGKIDKDEAVRLAADLRDLRVAARAAVKTHGDAEVNVDDMCLWLCHAEAIDKLREETGDAKVK